MKKILLQMLFLVLGLNLFSQEINLDGFWTLTSSNVESEVLIKENGIWRDCYKNNSPIEINGNKLQLLMDNKMVATQLIFKGNDVSIYFSSEIVGKESFVVFQYKLLGNSLVLYREDPVTKESYTFSKK